MGLDNHTAAQTEQTALTTRHTAIHDASQELFDAETPEAVRELATQLVGDHLGHRSVAFYRLGDGGAESTHRTAAFRELYGAPRLDPVPEVFRTAAEMRLPQTETEQVPFADAAACCVAPTGEGELLVCPLTAESCLSDRLRTHLNEVASLAGTALLRAETAATEPEQPAALVSTTTPVSDRPARAAVLDALDRSFPDYAFLYDRDGQYVDLLLGRRNVGERSRDQLVGATVYETLTANAADRVATAIRTAIDDWQTVSVEYPVETGGQTRRYEGMVSPVELAGEDRAVLVARDVTELRRRRDQLQRRNERLEAFTSIVCHDLKNPLNAAQGYLELVTTELDDPPERLSAVERALDRVEEISQGVLALAHHEQTDLDLATVDAERVATDCWTLTATADAELTVEPFELRADERSLRHVFENLFGNSLTHAGPETTVRVGPTADGFYVADDGPGVDPERREAVFESGTSFGETGSGVGLVVVETVADAHGWTVDLTESWAGGARFEFAGVTRDD
ncbi:MAG: PAS/PAC sensor signal transduction histidine kinase [halophilic archaeon J07HB67]|jgi:Signal transduction histidine kinase|nr:MAG: PAS/PAC sensor signal transduction histidine kinase [halophilic archaeon J07HB67]